MRSEAPYQAVRFPTGSIFGVRLLQQLRGTGIETHLVTSHYLLPLLVAQPGGLLVDLGCGDGYLTIEASRWASRVIAVDRSRPVLERAVLGNIVPDFPLINKSFNLSYSGHDL